MKKETEQDMLIVGHAYLHEPLSIPGTNLGTERTLHPARTIGLKMGWSVKMGGLVVRLKSKTALVPAANVAWVILSTPESEA